MNFITPLFLAFTFAVATVKASPIPDFPFVAVSGVASTKIKPDKAAITFSVMVYDASSATATNSVNETLQKVTAKIIKLGFPKESITADDLSKSAVRKKGENYNQLEILGYSVSRSVNVKINDINKYTDAIQLIMKIDNITSVRSSFDTTKRNEIEAELVSTACADAKRKATLMTEGIGAKLGDVFAISNARSSFPWSR